jgi:hypothetical protein
LIDFCLTTQIAIDIVKIRFYKYRNIVFVKGVEFSAGRILAQSLIETYTKPVVDTAVFLRKEQSRKTSE